MKACGRFVIGEANSTRYPNGELPAHRGASGASCKTLKRIARWLHNGMPARAIRATTRLGPILSVHDRGRTWSCRLQNHGLSGPSYAARCNRQHGRLRWRGGS
jgi:hypothetical protein